MLPILSLLLVIVLMITPFFGVCLSIFLDFWLSSYSVGPVPMRNYLVPVLMSLMSVLIIIKRKMPELHGYVLMLGVSTVIFIFTGIICRVVNQESLWDFIGRVIVPFCVMCYCVYFTNNVKRFRVFLYCLGLGMAVTSLVGIFQFIGMDWAWNLQALLNPVMLQNEASDTYLRARIAGLESYSIPLSYSLCAFIPLMAAISYAKGILSRFERIFFTLVAVLSSLAVLLSLVRSAILGIGIGVAYVILKRGETKGKIRAALLLGVLVVLGLSIPAVNYRMQQNTESTRGTIARTILGLRMAINNPLGTGGGSSRAFQESFDRYYGEIYDMDGAQNKNIAAAHNQFINVATYYGYLGFMLLCIFYFYIFKLTSYLKDQGCGTFVVTCVVGAEASVIAYTVNSMFHNAGPFMGEVYFWYLLAVIIMLSTLKNQLCQKSA